VFMMGRLGSKRAVSSVVVRQKIVKLYCHYADSGGEEMEN
jgi:hypothetical protein